MNVNKREQVITLAVAIGLAGLFLALWFKPRLNELRHIQQQNVQLAQETQTIAQECQQVTSLREELGRYSDVLSQARTRIPQKDHSLEFEGFLRDLGRKKQLVRSGIGSERSKEFLKDGLESRSDGLVIKEYIVSFRSDFDPFYAFLGDLENAELLARVWSLTVKPVEGRGEFDVEMKLNTYFGDL